MPETKKTKATSSKKLLNWSGQEWFSETIILGQCTMQTENVSLCLQTTNILIIRKYSDHGCLVPSSPKAPIAPGQRIISVKYTADRWLLTKQWP
jgi:hypothetical protein